MVSRTAFCNNDWFSVSIAVYNFFQCCQWMRINAISIIHFLKILHCCWIRSIAIFVIIQRYAYPVYILVTGIILLLLYIPVGHNIGRKQQCYIRSMISSYSSNFNICLFKQSRVCQICPNIHFSANSQKDRAI